MEERGAVGTKDKKYVLYTVVGDERGKTSAGIWAVRIILGVLLVIALAVVPYVSLRMAQVSDRTLVVFQPVLVRNHSTAHHSTPLSSLTAMKSVHNTNILQSASLTRKNTTATQSPERITSKTFSNGTIVTLYESAVTFSLIEDNANETKEAHMNSTGDKSKEESSEELSNSTSSDVPVSKLVSESVDSTSTTLEGVRAIRSTSASTIKATSYTQQKTVDSTISESSTFSPSKLTKDTITNFSTENTPSVTEFLESTGRPLPEIIKPVVSKKPSRKIAHNTMNHKLAYVAAASSGNHVGGICIWKTNRNITDWSYFFDNIPMEYQSHQDSTDRDLRGLLVAVRMWANKWRDYHVVIRSQSNALEGSSHRTRAVLISELEKNAEDNFTYELEWRLRKDDSLVAIAYSLARLYKDFNYWFNEFEQRLQKIAGKQAGGLSQNRVTIPQDAFATSQIKTQIQAEELHSLGKTHK